MDRMARRQKARENNLTERFLSGELEQDESETSQERFGSRSRDAEAGKILRTTQLRADEQSDIDVESLPIGQVLQVYSLFSEVEVDGRQFFCVTRKTLSKRSDSAIIVGDRVRVRDLVQLDERGNPKGVIEQVMPRTTVLTRADSFKGVEQHPIVANAQQMLIVASLTQPRVKWGLIDRMLIAAQSGKLPVVLCLNKVDLPASDDAIQEAAEVTAHYASIGIRTIRTSAPSGVGIAELTELLKGNVTVLAGHSGVGKSTLLNAVDPSLDLRTGIISGYTGKGRHTTTSARHYPLAIGGAVIDTPGVKMFGLWGVTRENLQEFFPDIEAGNAPEWRRESYDRIASSLTS
jgi:ribosome biogenesis GTPase